MGPPLDSISALYKRDTLFVKRRAMVGAAYRFDALYNRDILFVKLSGLPGAAYTREGCRAPKARENFWDFLTPK